jgi:superfamily II DNA or RNA helicase
MHAPLRIVVDARLRLRLDDLRTVGLRVRDIVALFEYDNPDFWKKQRMGMWTGQTPRTITLATVEDGELLLPRGGWPRLRRVLTRHGVAWDVEDRTVARTGPIGLTYTTPSTWSLGADHRAAARALLRHRNGILVGGCGSGKTEIMLRFVADTGERTLVVVHTERILAAWVEKASARFGLREADVGVLSGKAKRERPLTIAMVQTLRNVLKRDPAFATRWGCLVLDEAHHAAAATFSEVVNQFPAKYRVAATATPKRKDGKEAIFYDAFGSEVVPKPRGEGETVGPRVLFKITDEDLDRYGRIVPVDVVVVPTDFEFDLHREAELERAGWERRDREAALASVRRWADTTGWRGPLNTYADLLDALTRDRVRQARVLEYLLPEVQAGRTCLLLADRRELCLEVQAWLERRGLRAGRLMGGRNSKEQDATAEALGDGSLRVAVGTTVADEGMDVPRLDRGFGCTPAAGNAGRLTQQIGRFKRRHPDKGDAVYYYFWDRRVRGLAAHAREVAKTIPAPHRVWYSETPGNRQPLTAELLRRLEV